MKVDSINKKALKEQEMEQRHLFNSVTQSGKVENQNQTYNIRKESLGPNGKR